MHRMEIRLLVPKVKEANLTRQLAETFNGAALECINNEEGKQPEIYDAEYGGYFTKQRLLEKRAKDAKLKSWKRQRFDAKMHKETRMIKLAERTLDACNQLEARDPVAAYTNSICQQVFREKLPRHD